MSIVGWDDNVVFTRNGVTMKGAFLVANSWATSWMNDGYLWFMYDSINKKSEFAAQDATLNQSTRDYSLDQFCFTDWHDVEIGHPDLMISAEVTTKDREGTSLLLTRTDKESGETKTYQPRIFYYGDNNNHETYDVKAPDYLNYAGVVNGEDATANFTFSYEDLYDSIPSGKTQNDYVWGFRLIVEKGNTAKVGKVTLQDKNLTKLFEKTFNVTVPAENYEAQAYISCSSDCYIIPETSNMYTMTPAAGSKSPVKAGGSYSFTVTPSKGFTLQYASVLANGRVLTPDDNGVYTVENIQSSVAISVSNIVEDASYKKFNPSMYNSDGWEYWGNQYLMVVLISTSELRKDLYADPNKVGTENYPYYFRFTDQETGTSYYMQPSSFYDFGSSILYRLPFLNAGFSAKLDHVYSFTVDVLYQGHVLYTGTIKNTKCNFADDNADPNKNPPQKNNDTIVPSKDVHTVTYLRDGKKVGTDAFVEGSPIVNRAAVSNPEFKAVFSPALPETMGSANITATVAGAVYSLGDINGDGSVNVKDLSRLCLYLADNSTKCDAALVDANGDGSVKIDDVTYLIDKFSTSVTIEL